MAQIEVPDEEQLPPGPHRDLVLALHGLHECAGWPGGRQVSRKIEQEGYDGSMSHERFRAVLRGQGIPRWINVEPVVRVLAVWSTPPLDPDAEAARVLGLWKAAESTRRGRGQVSAPAVPVPRPETAPLVPLLTTVLADGLPENVTAAKLVAQAQRLTELGRPGEARIVLLRAATWPLDDLCELADWLLHHGSASEAEAVLRAAGGSRSVAEIAMLAERLAEAEQQSHTYVVLHAAGAQRPSPELNALIERMRSCGRRPELRQVLIGAGITRPLVLLQELFPLLEQSDRVTESRILLNAVAQHRATTELVDLLDYFAATRRISQAYWLLDVIARDRDARGVASFVDHLVPAKRDREAATVLETVGRHRAITDLYEVVGWLRQTGRAVSARHILEAVGTHRSIADLVELLTLLVKLGREPDLMHILDGARGHRAGGRLRKAIDHLRDQGVATEKLFENAGLTPDDLTRVEHSEADDFQRFKLESRRSEDITNALAESLGARKFTTHDPVLGVLVSWDLGSGSSLSSDDLPLKNE